MRLCDVINIILENGYLSIVDRANYAIVSKKTVEIISIDALYVET